MKKMLLGAFLGMFTLAGVAVLPNLASASEVDWSDTKGENNYVSGDGDQTLEGSALLDTIKNAINWILGILATIALVICLYGGFLMVTAAGDEKKYQKGLNVLKYAAIGLAIIGVSWMIVSVIFWFVNNLGITTQSDNKQKVNSQDTGRDTSTQGQKGRNGGSTSDGDFGEGDFAQESVTDEGGNPTPQPQPQPDNNPTPQPQPDNNPTPPQQ